MVVVFKKRLVYIILSIIFFCSISCSSEKGPNILFLVIEDTSPYLFPAYGNQTIKTPNLDWMAENGLVFTNAFANAPYCSPARSTLISGTQATVYGNDIHREGHLQKEQYFLVKKLTDEGYFTVNNGKTDYNIKGKEATKIMETVWSINGDKATYNDPSRSNRPFFAQFNNMSTHMSRMTTIITDNRLKCTVDPATVKLPPYVPDLPEMRSDYALHLEGVQNIDKWVGAFLNDLKDKKELENTIVFFFSDHGGCLPRGKAFPFDTGHRVPLIVYAPDKYKDILPGPRGGTTDRMVSFDDFIPTVMSLAGIKKPNYITGKPFMGKYEENPRKYVYMFRTNNKEHFDPTRSVYDGRFHYLRNYIPYKIHGLTQSFQWQMPSQLAWDAHFMSGEAADHHSTYYQSKPVEALFDLKKDPWELNNLALDPDYQEKLVELRSVNNRNVRDIKDLGFLSWDERTEITNQGKDFYSWVREKNYPIDSLISLAEKASFGNLVDLPFFIQNLRSANSSFQFWGMSGIVNIAKKGLLKEIPEEVYPLLNSKAHEDVSVLAAETMVLMGREKEGLNFLMSKFKPGSQSVSSLENLWGNVYLKEAEAGLWKIVNDSNDEQMRIQARSLLIKLGKLDICELYEQHTIDENHKIYLRRVENYMENIEQLNIK